MKNTNSFLIDKYGHLSSKRVCGVFGFIVFLLMAILSGFNFYNVDPTIIIGGLGTCAGLLASTAFERQPEFHVHDKGESGL